MFGKKRMFGRDFVRVLGILTLFVIYFDIFEQEIDIIMILTVS